MKKLNFTLSGTRVVRYPLSLGAGSEKYGPCEICGKKMEAAYISGNEFMLFIFGHKECLADTKEADAQLEAELKEITKLVSETISYEQL